MFVGPLLLQTPCRAQTFIRHRPPPRLGLLNALGASYIYQCRIILHTLLHQKMHNLYGPPEGANYI